MTAAWLMFPHQPNVGFGRPAAIEVLAATTSVDNCAAPVGTTCDGAVFGAMLGSIVSMEKSRSALLDTLARVKADLRANGTRLGASS